MVKRSKKSKSKRVSLKKKYKIIKKVKEHHKKKAKEAKKLGFNKKAKVEKDPGIPNDWPFKEQELKALEERRERSIKELEEKKTARKARAEKRKFGQLEDEKMDTIVEESTTVDSVVTKTYDHSERAFYKELVKVIDNSDVILEILDARDPLGTRCVDMEKMVIKSGAHKHIVLVLNKIDLVPRESAEKWLKYFREELPAVAFKCSTQEQKSNLGWKSTPKFKKTGKSGNTGNTSNLLQTSDCLGGESLLKLLQSYSKSHGIKKSITVGVIGLPNVGKSSLINSMKRTRVVNVGATPGLTRSMQEVQLLDNVKLLDCPGVVMLKSAENDASVALRNCKRIEKLEDPVAPVKQILTLCPESVLVTLYKIPSFKSVDDFIQKVATVRGKLKKGGIADVEATARIVLHDWNEGKIPYFTMPPSRNASDPADAKIVNELGKEFNVEEFYKESSFIGSLKSVDDFNHPVEVPTNSPFNFDMTLLENDEQKKAPTVDNAGDEVMETKEDDASVTVSEDKFSNKGQNKKLYAQQGILNPKLKKAEKKRRKKGNQASAMEDGDYDFKVDYVRDADADASMEDVAQEKNENRFDLPSGVELDNE